MSALVQSTFLGTMPTGREYFLSPTMLSGAVMYLLRSVGLLLTDDAVLQHLLSSFLIR